VKTPAKVLLWVVGGLALLLVAVIAAVAVLFDPDTFRPELEARVAAATGRELRLEGGLGLDFIPCCSVTLGPAALGNPPGFPAGDFIRVQSAALGLRVWPLIARREVQLGVVRLEGLEANLLARADGADNWSFATEGERATPEGEDAGAGVASLDIAGIRVTGGRISYRDEQDASAYLVEDLALETGDISGTDPFDVKLSGRVTEEAAKLTADLALAATATVDPATGQLVLAKPLLDFKAGGEGLPAKGLTGKLGAAEIAVATEPATSLALRNFQGEFELPGLEAVAGDVTGSFVAETARVDVGGSTEFTMPKLSVDVTATGKEIPGDTVSAKIAATDVALDADKLLGAVGALTADVNGLGARLAVTGGGRLSEAGAELRGALKLDPVSPRSLLAVLREPEPATADPKALTRLAGTADWALGKDSVELANMDFTLDQSRITGRVGFAPLDEPVTRFDVAVDAIDVDRYLAPEGEVAAEAAPTGGPPAGVGAASAATPSSPAATPPASSAGDDIPVATIRDLRLDGRLAIGALAFGGAKLSAFTATVRAADGRLRLDPVAAKAYGGDYRGSITVDATGPVAALTTEQSLAAVQVAPVLKDLYQSGKLTGALTGRISVRGTGNTTDALIRTLDGTVALDLADGAYLGTDLWHEIRKARNLIRREAPPPAPATPRTPLEAAELAGTITNGRLRTDKLLAQVPFIRLTAEGSLDLVGKTMDYAARAQVIEDPVFEDGKKLKDLKGLTIPVTLKGPMAEPAVRVDLKGLATGIATEKLMDRLNKKLGLDQPEPDGAATGTTGEPATTEPPKDEKPRDALKRQLRDLLKPR